MKRLAEQFSNDPLELAEAEAHLCKTISALSLAGIPEPFNGACEAFTALVAPTKDVSELQANYDALKGAHKELHKLLTGGKKNGAGKMVLRTINTTLAC